MHKKLWRTLTNEDAHVNVHVNEDAQKYDIHNTKQYLYCTYMPVIGSSKYMWWVGCDGVDGRVVSWNII